MKPSDTFYNDNDSYVTEWLGNLITAGHLAEGAVDARSILEIEPAELGSFRQCHFFVGIGGWPYALALAEWPSDREVWTASCPCQPLSSAGQRRGHADERHLWPALYHLIAERRPPTIFGEQVSSKDGREWFAGVRADLEGLGYAVGCLDLCAASVGAPHIRQRLFWVADAGRERREHRRLNVAGAPRGDQGERHQRERLWPDIGDGGATGGVADAELHGRDECKHARNLVCAAGSQSENERLFVPNGAVGHCAAGGVALSSNSGRGAQQGRHDRKDGWSEAEPGRLRDAGRLGKADPNGLSARKPAAPPLEYGRPSVANGSPWSDGEWLPCLDGKARRIESGSFPLVTRLSEDMGSDRPGEASPFRIIRDPKTGKSIGQAPWRVGMLRGYGNSIVPQVAAEFVKAFLETSEMKPSDRETYR